MQRYIAFLGGLPVGRSAVSSEKLHAMFSRLGFLEIDTYLTTGNVAFLTPPVGIIGPLEGQISRFLSKETKEDVEAFIRLPKELSKIASLDPFAGQAETGAAFTIFLHETVSRETTRRLERISGADRFHVVGREIYWLRVARGTQPPAAPVRLSQILEAPATVRSCRTVKRLATRYEAEVTGSVRSRR
jgi:uncharacterized protein (DUF1697 family)